MTGSASFISKVLFNPYTCLLGGANIMLVGLYTILPLSHLYFSVFLEVTCQSWNTIVAVFFSLALPCLPPSISSRNDTHGERGGSGTRYLPCSYCFNQLEHRHAVGHGKGNETGMYQSSAQHLLIISLLCVSCVRTAHPLTAAHTEKARGMLKNILRKVEFVYIKISLS